jgi:carbamoyltransferase
MYAVDVLADKKKTIPAVLHVDDTCRIQTISKNQNQHYYKLIESFYQLTGIPIIFNTSFNLAGDCIVESLDDALDTLQKSQINYLYLPEYNLLVS